MNNNEANRSDDFAIELAGPDQGAALLTFINKIQPHIQWDDAQLRWQFFESPAGSARIYTIRSEGEIVSLYCACPKDFSVDGEKRKAFMVQDVMTDPAYRGRGFLHRQAAECVSDLKSNNDVGYTFPNKLSEGSFRRRSWAELMQIPVRMGETRSSLMSSGDLASPLAGDLPAEATEIWRNSGLRIGVERSAEYLNWRYRRPHEAYIRFSIGGGVGILILKLYDSDDCRLLHICDLIVVREARKLVKDVLGFCHGFARMNGAVRITAWLPDGHPYADDFDTLGLQRDRTCDRFAFAIPPQDAAGFLTASDWHLTQGDSDVY